MITARREDKQLVIDILSPAFDRNKSVNYIVRQDSRRRDRIRLLMDYSFETCLRYGQVFLSDDRNACALILFPDQKRTTLSSVWRDLKLIFRVIGLGAVPKILKREAAVKRLQPKLPMCYLWFIGVDPDHQHRGWGTALLQDVLTYAHQAKRQLYLETSTDRNIPRYRSFGMEIYEQMDLDYRLYFLKQV